MAIRSKTACQLPEDNIRPDPIEKERLHVWAPNVGQAPRDEPVPVVDHTPCKPDSHTENKPLLRSLVFLRDRLEGRDSPRLQEVEGKANGGEREPEGYQLSNVSHVTHRSRSLKWMFLSVSALSLVSPSDKLSLDNHRTTVFQRPMSKTKFAANMMNAFGLMTG